MALPAPSAAFGTANPHALATILEASETKSIIASRDIFDLAGTKLWARDQPVSQALQRKLIDRQLRHPLETCLYAEDGVTNRSLVLATEALVDSDTPLASLLRRYEDRLVHSATHLPLHSVAQLLLTAGQASRPDSFQHAVQAMALAGVLAIARGGDTRELRQAMICGLLHDIGEMYIDPMHGEAEADRDLDVHSYRQLVVHPHIGRVLVEQLTNYPADVARAIGEHHERLDGSGYPHALQRDQVSALGRLMAVTDGVLAALRGDHGHLARASVALRAVPGEYDLKWAALVSYGSRGQPAPLARGSHEHIAHRLQQLDLALQARQDKAELLMLGADTPELKAALSLSLHLVGRLRVGFNASGLWSREAMAVQDAAEVEAVEEELTTRLRAVQRAVRLRAGELLPPEDAERLELLCEGPVPA